VREQVGVPPAGAIDAATKGYVDSLAALGSMPPSGAWAYPLLASQANVAPAGQTIYFAPIVIPDTLTIQSAACHLSTAASGGAGLGLTMGLYRGTGFGAPDLSQLVFSQSLTDALTATGRKTVAASATLTAGTYWTAFLYRWTTAPSTGPNFVGAANPTSVLWIPDATAFTAGPMRCLTLTGQSALPTTNALTPSPSSAGATVVALRRA
jgi:hypothetical protein